MARTIDVPLVVSVTGLTEVVALAHAARDVVDHADEHAEGYLVPLHDLRTLDAAVSALLPGAAD